VLPDDATKEGTLDGLSVDLGIDVVLVGLPPVYAHGLYVGLTATGLRCTVLPATGGLAAPSGPGRTLVAVVPSALSPSVETVHGARRAAVHVLVDGSPRAYSDALRAGATGAFAPNAELADILRILLCAGLGLTVLPVDVARALNQRSVGSRPELAERDLQYLRLLSQGATVAGLGRRFAHSEREMYRLLSVTYQRLGARNRTEALLLAQRFGLLEEGV
jgi:DNA-binding NarL/FixJ family response regulator